MTNASDKSRQPSPTIVLPQTAAVDWLLRSATVSTTASSMLAELCNRLVDEDLPITGAQLTVTSLHPMVARRQIRWRRGDARIAEEIHFHGITPAADDSADSVSLKLSLPGTHHQVEWLAERPESLSAKICDCLLVRQPARGCTLRPSFATLARAWMICCALARSPRVIASVFGLSAKIGCVESFRWHGCWHVGHRGGFFQRAAILKYAVILLERTLSPATSESRQPDAA